MRTIGLAVALLVCAAASARADVNGIYDVKYEEVSSNCTSPLRYPAGKLTVKIIGNSITVDIDRTPLMGGIPAGDKISAKSKVGNTMLDGMQGVFSVAGKVTPEGLIHLVFVGEYQVKGKPLCSQTWNVTGPRVDSGKPKKSAKPTAKKSDVSQAAPVDRRERYAVVADLVDLARIGR
jgi:hypothetical protein